MISGMHDGQPRQVVTELFSPPRVNARITRQKIAGMSGGTSFDLVADAVTGKPWDFLDAGERRRCWQRLKSEDPWVVIGSPPCTAFNILNIGLNRNRDDPAERNRKETETQVLLASATSVYTWQARRGRYFVHEHPASASS